MAIPVALIRNVLTGMYLTYIGSTFSIHQLKYHPDNFHVYDDGPHRYIQVFSDSTEKLLYDPGSAPGDCTHDLNIDPTGSEFYTDRVAAAGIKLFVKDSNGNKFYLRVNRIAQNSLEFVCQSYVDNNQGHPFFQKELEFDLVSVDVNEMMP